MPFYIRSDPDPRRAVRGPRFTVPDPEPPPDPAHPLDDTDNVVTAFLKFKPYGFSMYNPWDPIFLSMFGRAGRNGAKGPRGPRGPSGSSPDATDPVPGPRGTPVHPETRVLLDPMARWETRDPWVPPDQRVPEAPRESGPGGSQGPRRTQGGRGPEGPRGPTGGQRLPGSRGVPGEGWSGRTEGVQGSSGLHGKAVCDLHLPRRPRRVLWSTVPPGTPAPVVREVPPERWVQPVPAGRLDLRVRTETWEVWGQRAQRETTVPSAQRDLREPPSSNWNVFRISLKRALVLSRLRNRTRRS
ncbi:hypothetical protein [European catfish virus]|uniref:Uncharacterized protein n=1 Tax=European catfish virus TaxID=84739 RepID=I2BFN5_9VIRU|nr:hypothetical protein A190_gp055 [European catfish virus]AFJ52338.1 hypothetical protein [European catfish virus]AMZ04884.1 hypothetical protein [European catfish virus]AMZ05020.1 hypothetical protein [European catfish virus]